MPERLGIQEAWRGSYSAESKQADFTTQRTGWRNNPQHVSFTSCLTSYEWFPDYFDTGKARKYVVATSPVCYILRI